MVMFVPGSVVATRGALAALDRMDVNPTTLIDRHVCGDWGDLGVEDCKANQNALTYGARIVSAYVVQQEKFYVITEWDRSYTTLMTASEY